MLLPLSHALAASLVERLGRAAPVHLWWPKHLQVELLVLLLARGGVVEPDDVDVAPVLERPRFTRCASQQRCVRVQDVRPRHGDVLARVAPREGVAREGDAIKVQGLSLKKLPSCSGLLGNFFKLSP